MQSVAEGGCAPSYEYTAGIPARSLLRHAIEWLDNVELDRIAAMDAIHLALAISKSIESMGKCSETLWTSDPDLRCL
jgi:hypothetical protein